MIIETPWRVRWMSFWRKASFMRSLVKLPDSSGTGLPMQLWSCLGSAKACGSWRRAGEPGDSRDNALEVCYVECLDVRGVKLARCPMRRLRTSSSGARIRRVFSHYCQRRCLPRSSHAYSIVRRWSMRSGRARIVGEIREWGSRESLFTEIQGAPESWSLGIRRTAFSRGRPSIRHRDWSCCFTGSERTPIGSVASRTYSVRIALGGPWRIEGSAQFAIDSLMRQGFFGVPGRKSDGLQMPGGKPSSILKRPVERWVVRCRSQSSPTVLARWSRLESFARAPPRSPRLFLLRRYFLVRRSRGSHSLRRLDRKICGMTVSDRIFGLALRSFSGAVLVPAEPRVVRCA